MYTIIYILFAAIVIMSPFWLRKKTKQLAAKKKIFVAVPANEVMCLSKANDGGASVCLASLKGTGFSMDRDTGQVCKGEDEDGIIKSFLGVEFIGYSEIINLPIATVDGAGKVTTKYSSSIRFVDDITVHITEAETKGGIFPINMNIEVTTRIFNMRTLLSYKEGYQKKVDTLIKAVVNEYAKDKDPDVIIGLKNEKPDGNKKPDGKPVRSDFMDLIMSLNFGHFGNVSLTELVGVEILAVSITDSDPSSKELRDLMEAAKKAELKGNAAIVDAEKKAKEVEIAAKGEAEATKAKAAGEAQAVTLINKAKTAALKKKLEALGGNAEALVGLETAEAIKVFNEKGGGTLAVNTPIAISLPSKK